jgi:hypothetical protein
VLDQHSGEVPARNADRLIMWFIGFVVIGVGVNLFSGFVIAQKWAWLPRLSLLRRSWSLCRLLVFCGGSVITQRGLGT